MGVCRCPSFEEILNNKYPDTYQMISNLTQFLNDKREDRMQAYWLLMQGT